MTAEAPQMDKRGVRMLARLIAILALVLVLLPTQPAAAATTATPKKVASSAVTHNSISVKWGKVSGATKYTVKYATKSSMKSAKSKTSTKASAKLTGLKAGTTYYVTVTATSKKGKSKASKVLKVKTAAKPKPQPAPPEKPGTGGPATIRVVSYNVGSHTVEDAKHPWSARRGVVSKAVLAQRPDVIGFQEAGQGKMGTADLSQAEDLVKLLGAPYKMANTARYNCENPTTPYKCVSKNQGAANSQKIVYNSATLKLISQGSKKTSSSKTRFEEQRYVEWAIFRHIETGKQFFFANVHLDPGKTSAAITMRKKQMDEILAAIKAQNPNNLPAYVVGDFNSHKWLSDAEGRNAPYDRMIAAGYVDPLGNTWMSKQETPGATVEKRINTQYSSHNDWNRQAPKKDWVNGIYLDYIWTSKGIRVPEWETVVNVDAAGNFIGTIPSDHNMLRATTVIR